MGVAAAGVVSLPAIPESVGKEVANLGKALVTVEDWGVKLKS
jgi:hypothetical protein